MEDPDIFNDDLHDVDVYNFWIFLDIYQLKKKSLKWKCNIFLIMNMVLVWFHSYVTSLPLF